MLFFLDNTLYQLCIALLDTEGWRPLFSVFVNSCANFEIQILFFVNPVEILAFSRI
jgi:hypothetical protein